jgi:hypothetical protein
MQNWSVLRMTDAKLRSLAGACTFCQQFRLAPCHLCTPLLSAQPAPLRNGCIVVEGWVQVHMDVGTLRSRTQPFVTEGRRRVRALISDLRRAGRSRIERACTDGDLSIWILDGRHLTNSAGLHGGHAPGAGCTRRRVRH